MAAAPFPLTVSGVRELRPDFRCLYFEETIAYEAGQFLTFQERIGGQEVRRSYSLITSPALDPRPAIGVRRVDNGLFSRFLFEKVMPGQQLLCVGASGLFKLPPVQRPGALLCFFAAGSGITPILSLLRTALATRPKTRVVLVYSSHDPESALFLSELQELASAYKDRFSLHLLFSTDKQLHRARLNRSLLLELLSNERALSGDAWFFCCGPENYMRLCTYVLREQGVAADRIRREDFIPGTPPPPRPAPFLPAQTVRISAWGKDHEVQVSPPDTILKAALRAGIDLPWSCGNGRCGSCTVRCNSGQVWMATNEVLTDSDLAAGFVLTCTAFPADAAVWLQLP